MRTRRSDNFTTVIVEGQILPADLLQRVVEKDSELGGLTPESYHLSPGETVNEATSRAWNKLTANWSNFKHARAKLPANDPGTTITRDRWLLPLFQELGYGRLPATRAAVAIDGKSYAISHWWSNVPIHLVGYGVSLDRLSARVAGAARSSPHSLTQELLNRSEDALWGFVSNGLQLRILRDNQNLVRQAYVEFDLEAMMDGEAYSDFVMLWLLCHQSRVEAEKSTDFWLERWSRAAQERGVRALEHLREGVEEAISLLGSGFIAHRANAVLKEKLRTGLLNKQDYYRQLLRLVYRLLFLFVAEDRTDEKNRSLIFDPTTTPEACQRYTHFYSTKKLRRLAERRLGSLHSDLYASLRLVMQKLGSDIGCAELGLPALGSFLFSEEAIADLNDCEIANHDLLNAVRALAFATDVQARRQIDYKNLGSEELGSVYESLLELYPQLNLDAATFTLSTAAGHERKTTGSYYTPDNLVQCLLDSALDPVLDDRERNYLRLGYKSGEEAILDLKICDPACGSGHFLIAAAHRIAKRLAQLRTGDAEPSPEAVRHALRDIVGRCLYGVDINPMAVELCKVSLWMEGLEPGRPLSFLDHHIVCGNSLLGTTPALINVGIPDDAFNPIEGDDPKLCAEYKKQNRRERQQETLRGFHGDAWDQLGNLATRLMSIDEISDDTIEGVHRRQLRYETLVNSTGYRYGELLADAWCAAFVWEKRKSEALLYPITEGVFREIEENPFNVPKWMAGEIKRLATHYQFFHWHLAFPGVFRVLGTNEVHEDHIAGWDGGFDVIVGNPPWETLELSEKEFFSNTAPHVVEAENRSKRKKLIQQLSETNPSLFASYLEASRFMLGQRALIQSAGLFPLTSYGRINTAFLFAELGEMLPKSAGYAGMVIPSGVATDVYNKKFFDHLMQEKKLVTLYDFENRNAIFVGVHRMYKFCLLTISNLRNHERTLFVFSALTMADVCLDTKKVWLSARDIETINPNTRTCPIFTTRRDAEICIRIHRAYPVIHDEASGSNPYGLAFWTTFYIKEASAKFFLNDELTDDSTWIGVYEAKMAHQYDHRFASFCERVSRVSQVVNAVELTSAQKLNASFEVMPRYYVKEDDLVSTLAERPKREWFLGVRDVTNSQNERTAIGFIYPRWGSFDTIRNMSPTGYDGNLTCAFLANINTFPFDYLVRQKLGGMHFTFSYSKQVPVISPTELGSGWWAGKGNAVAPWLMDRVIELVYTSWDLQPFAEDCGYTGAPFRWDDDRRFLIRSELDAAFFQLYRISRDEADYIMETFPIVKRKDEDKYGHYRTKRVILETYDEMTQAIATGQPYQSRLEPPPSFPDAAHPQRLGPAPLVMPTSVRYPQPDESVYMMRVILSMLQMAGGSIGIDRLMNACSLLAMPDRLETYGHRIEPNLAHEWRRRFSDHFRPDQFLAKVDDLVQRGEIRLVQKGGGFRVIRVSKSVLPSDVYIEFDAAFALRTSDSLLASEKIGFVPLATRDQIAERSRVALR